MTEENLHSKINEEEEELLDLDELEKEWEEEQRKKQEQRQFINGVHEEIEFDVIDVSVTMTGTLLELYTPTGDVYVVNLDDNARKIMKLIESGKIVHVKAVRIKGYKRLQEILEMSETRKIRAKKGRKIKGILEVIGRTLRITEASKEGKGRRFYLNEGTINYDRLAGIANLIAPSTVILVASQIHERHGQRGIYYLVRGFYIVRPKPEEVIPKGEVGQEEEEEELEPAEQQEEVNPNKLPETIEV